MKGTDFTEILAETPGGQGDSHPCSVKSVPFIRALRVESSLFRQTNHIAIREIKSEPQRPFMSGIMLRY